MPDRHVRLPRSPTLFANDDPCYEQRVQRVTISIDEGLADALDRLLATHGYSSRSEGMRDLVRDAVRREEGIGDDHAHCAANLSYVYDRDTRALAERLSDMQHAHHDLVVSTHTVRLDHSHSFESILLKGHSGAVRAFASKLLAERGVRFGTLNLVPVEADDQHAHAEDHAHHGHLHLHPVRI